MDIVFTDAALDDLRRIGPVAVSLVLKKIFLLETNPMAGEPLGGELTGYRKLVVGNRTWRIVYRVVDSGQVEVCEIWAIGLRSDGEVYAEASVRVAKALTRQPNMAPLASVIVRLGRLTVGVQLPETLKRREPVPDWLAERLVYTAGMTRADVAALDAEEALDAWTQFISSPRD